MTGTGCKNENLLAAVRAVIGDRRLLVAILLRYCLGSSIALSRGIGRSSESKKLSFIDLRLYLASFRSGLLVDPIGLA